MRRSSMKSRRSAQAISHITFWVIVIVLGVLGAGAAAYTIAHEECPRKVKPAPLTTYDEKIKQDLEHIQRTLDRVQRKLEK